MTKKYVQVQVLGEEASWITVRGMDIKSTDVTSIIVTRIKGYSEKAKLVHVDP